MPAASERIWLLLIHGNSIGEILFSCVWGPHIYMVLDYPCYYLSAKISPITLMYVSVILLCAQHLIPLALSRLSCD